MIIAFPLGYYTGSRWLLSFAYKTPVSWWIFALSGMSALVIIILSISYQTIKAAVANPADTLRYE